MKLVHGWGINDADYVVQPTDENGKQYMCLVYRCWMDMIRRCYCYKYQAEKPTYIGCRVDERWRRFMAFQEWYLEQDPQSGGQLDKDFLGDGKLYSPETCCFVSRQLNNLFTDRGAKRGKYPQGVTYDKRAQKYQARIRQRGRNRQLGYFDTPEEASAVYLKAKATYVEEFLVEFPQPPRLAAAIRRKMTELIESETALWYVNQSPKSKTHLRSISKVETG